MGRISPEYSENHISGPEAEASRRKDIVHRAVLNAVASIREGTPSSPEANLIADAMTRSKEGSLSEKQPAANFSSADNSHSSQEPDSVEQAEPVETPEEQEGEERKIHARNWLGRIYDEGAGGKE